MYLIYEGQHKLFPTIHLTTRSIMKTALILLVTLVANLGCAFDLEDISAPVVLLGGCRNVAIQAGTAISFDGTQTVITSGDIGVAPGTSITGNYKLQSGTAHSNDAYAQQCTVDTKAAYNQAASQTCTNLIASDLANLTLYPGVYCTPSGKFIISAGSLVLDALGNPTAKWVFQTESTLVTAGATSVSLTNGANANNVFWAVGSSVTLGSSSGMVGNLLAQVSITFGSGSQLSGRGLAQAAVTFASGSESNSGDTIIGLPTAPTLPPVQARLQAIGIPTSSVSLGGCKNSALQAQTTITFDGAQTVIASGDIGVAPGTSITGNYKLQSGTAHSNDAYAQQCTVDTKAAYNQAASQTCTNLIASDLANLTLYPGVYCTPSGKFIISAGSLVLDALGNPTAKWVFQTESTLVTAGATSVSLTNGANANNVFWAVGSSVTLGSSSGMVGNLLAQVSITFGSGSQLSGRGLAQAAVTFASGSENNSDGQTIIGLPDFPLIQTLAAHNLRG